MARAGVARQELLAKNCPNPGSFARPGVNKLTADDSFETNPGCFHGQAMNPEAGVR